MVKYKWKILQIVLLPITIVMGAWYYWYMFIQHKGYDPESIKELKKQLKDSKSSRTSAGVNKTVDESRCEA